MFYLLIGLLKVRLSPVQSVRNATVWLTAHLPCYSHISTFMLEQLHWIPLCTRIILNILILFFKTQLRFPEIPTRSWCTVLFRTIIAFSHHPLRSSNRLDLLVPHARTAMAQSWPFVSIIIIIPFLWNALSLFIRSEILVGNRSSSFTFLKTYFFSHSLAH